MAYHNLSQRSGGDSAVLAALGDPTRRRVLELLRPSPLHVEEIARNLPVSRPAVSQHLKILKEAQLVCEHQRGTRHYFSLNPAGFGSLREYADTMWREALDAFAAYVAGQKKASKRVGTRERKER
jgi:DNA-binding transcriptional ArsR family regulator